MLTFNDGMWVKKVSDPLPVKGDKWPNSTIANGSLCWNIDANTGDTIVFAYDDENNVWISQLTKE